MSITEENIRQKIVKLKNTKTAGPDQTTNEMFKYGETTQSNINIKRTGAV